MVAKNITLPLYYTGLTDTALIQEQVRGLCAHGLVLMRCVQEGPASLYTLARDYSVEVALNMQPLVRCVAG